MPQTPSDGGSAWAWAQIFFWMATEDAGDVYPNTQTLRRNDARRASLRIRLIDAGVVRCRGNDGFAKTTSRVVRVAVSVSQDFNDSFGVTVKST